MAIGPVLRGAPKVRAAARPTVPRRDRAARAGGLLVVLWCLAGAGCGPPGDVARAGTPLLYVSNARDGTLTRIDTASGRVVGPALPAGGAPSRLVAGPAG